MSSPKEEWRARLKKYCSDSGIEEPAYNTFSDRRGGRTAWSCTVTVLGRTFAARYWFDGPYAANALEDAAEVALKYLDPKGQYSQVSSQEPLAGFVERA